MVHIEALRELMSGTKEYELLMAWAFIDFQRAFDTIYPKATTVALNKRGAENPKARI